MAVPTLTLDWNCVISVENDETSAGDVRALMNLHRQGCCELALLATSASENLRGTRGFPGSYKEFKKRLAALGWNDLPVLKTPGVVGLTFIDACYVVDQVEYCRLRGEIWKILFPDIPENRVDRELATETNEARLWSPEFAKWRNAWCDVHSLITHIDHKRDIFVTSNTNDFQKSMPHLLRFGVGNILSPTEAAATIGA